MNRRILKISGFLIISFLLTFSATACSSPNSQAPSSQASRSVEDKTPPSVTSMQPTGLILASDTTVIFSYTDGSSGIDSASSFVYLDNVAIVGCTKSEASINCLTKGLVDGTHNLTAQVKDKAGNVGTGARTFTVDATGPGFTELTVNPSDILSNVMIVAHYSDAGSGINTASAVVTVDGAKAMCSPTDKGGVICTAFDLSNGDHSYAVTIMDNNGHVSTASNTFTIGGGGGGTNCDPNYVECVPKDSDVDCAGGSGNGPSYVAGPVHVKPGGSDVYGLDGDGDGIGCE